MPLTYLSMKAVLEHMEPNKRLTLAAHCPRIRELHQQVPLVINHLLIKENSFILNGFNHFFFTTLVHFEGGTVPRNLRDNRESVCGGWEYDVDEFGKPEQLYLDQRPGDLKIRVYWDQEEDDDVNPFQKQPKIGSHGNDSQKQKFNSYVSYVCEKPGLQEPVKLPAGIKIRDALRHFLGVLFNGKTTIRHLEFYINNGIARLPEGPQIEVHTLSCHPGTPEVCMALNFKRPLRNLNTYTNKTLVPGKADGPLVVNFGFIVTEAWMQLLDHFLSNRTIHFSRARWIDDNVRIILSYWLQKPRQIGARISFHMGSVQNVLDYLILDFRSVVKGVLTENKCQEFPYCGTVQMDQGAKQLNIYGEQCPEGLFLDDRKDVPHMIVFEVMNPGSSKVVLE